MNCDPASTMRFLNKYLLSKQCGDSCLSSNRKIFFFLIKLAIILVLLPTLAFGGPQHKFYYFNPDSFQSNFGQLKHEMDLFFSQAGIPITFQPFARFVDFKKAVNKDKPAFLFLPDWFLQKHGGELRLQPILIPIQKGKKSYKKVLLVSKLSGINLQNLKNRSLATTPLGPDAETILNKILFIRHDLDAKGISIITVPKDTDALFALALGQVDMALVVKENIKEIVKINPRITQTTKLLLESGEISMPTFCHIKGVASPEEIEMVKNTFLNNRTKQHFKIMEMLKIDGWQTIDN